MSTERTIGLRLVEVASGAVNDCPVPAKAICQYDGARILVVQVPDPQDGPAIAAMADQLRAAYGNASHVTLMLPVRSLDAVTEYELRVPLPSADDADAVEWFAKALEAAWVRRGWAPMSGWAPPGEQRKAFQEDAAVFLRALAEWPGGAA